MKSDAEIIDQLLAEYPPNPNRTGKMLLEAERAALPPVPEETLEDLVQWYRSVLDTIDKLSPNTVDTAIQLVNKAREAEAWKAAAEAYERGSMSMGDALIKEARRG